jgi:hypothetical protein
VTAANNYDQLPDPNLVAQAMSAIAAFEQSKFPGIWSAIGKPQLVAEMRSRVQDPFQVNQGQQPFCGPASLLFELIRHNPLKYVQICRNLYQLGGFSTKTKWIYPSPELLADQGNPQMPIADWMVLATLRESENILFPIQTNSHEIIRNIAGMTKPWEMQGWLQEILNYRDVQFTSTFLTRDLQVMQQAAHIINAGGVALALVTSEGLLYGDAPPVPLPNHWVSLVGNIVLSSDRISFDIFTWAKKMHVDVSENRFKSHFWGVVTGKP